MTLTIDIGNTRMKWALFEEGRLVLSGLDGEPMPEGLAPDCAMVCATGRLDLEALKLGTHKVWVLQNGMPLPIGIDYATPYTLGPDRIAAACGAKAMTEGRGCVIIDAGTCITVDYLDPQGVYRGGAILPGFEMKFRALHTFTAKLPLITSIDSAKQPVTGRSTQESIEAGVLTATRYAVEGFVRHYRTLDPEALVVVTGGDANWLLGEGCLQVGDCRWEPLLVMQGLAAIADYLTKLENN